MQVSDASRMPDELSELRDSASLLEETSAEESGVNGELGEGRAANDGDEQELSFSQGMYQVKAADSILMYYCRKYSGHSRDVSVGFSTVGELCS